MKEEGDCGPPTWKVVPDYLLLDIFLHLRSETWTQWTIEVVPVKVHHWPYSFEDGPVVYSAWAFDSRLRGD